MSPGTWALAVHLSPPLASQACIQKCCRESGAGAGAGAGAGLGDRIEEGEEEGAGVGARAGLGDRLEEGEEEGAEDIC